MVDISVPYSAMLSKLPDPSTDRMNMVATMPSSPTKQSLSADSDLINTLGIALLAAESTASFDSEALQSSSSQPKKVKLVDCRLIVLIFMVPRL